jgi:signal transduction histidine kinase
MTPVELPNPTVQQYAQDILRSADVIDQVIRHLQQARVQPGPANAGRGDDISSLVARAVDIFRPVADKASIALSSDIAGPIFAIYDSPRLFEAIASLIENALAHTRAGGAIAVGVRSNTGECLISVADTGVGIPTSELDVIFDPFHERRGGGRRPGGMGLYIARSVVEAHNGRLWVESEIGLGSVFYIALPLA